MTKVVFLSKEWIKKADSVLKDLVSEFGEEGKRFSVSEALAEAPAEISEENGFVYYHILIVDRKNSEHEHCIVRIRFGEVLLKTYFA